MAPLYRQMEATVLRKFEIRGRIEDHLFAEFLRGRLQRERLESVAHLHLRAAARYRTAAGKNGHDREAAGYTGRSAMSLQRWFYRGGRPNRAARVLDRVTAAVYARGVSPNYLVTLEVPGRSTGRTIRFPLVMVVVEGERYLVSMLGGGTNWVQNMRAAGGRPSCATGVRRRYALKRSRLIGGRLC